MGKNDTEFEHDGVKIVYKNGKWDYDNASDLRYACKNQKTGHGPQPDPSGKTDA